MKFIPHMMIAVGLLVMVAAAFTLCSTYYEWW